jgi:DNA-binding MarR family transcriptional regulator/GNAT superfamily N-acetyltransferase
MDEKAVGKVRYFNRTVTQRLGVLHDEFLGRCRPLGASRVMWEIGEGPTDVRSLRTRLDLDSGYLSRLLRSLEADQLVQVEPDPGDRRVRRVTLTEAGRAEHDLVDTRSDELAWSLLAPLSQKQRTRLVEAMAEVERLLTAGLVEVAVEDPRTDAARHCIESYFRELDERFENGFDPELTTSADADDLTDPNGLLLIARLHDEPIGCGALRLEPDPMPEIKRMWVDPAARGLGVGRRILHELEEQTRQRGHDRVRLDSNKALTEAHQLYHSAGYRDIERFNDNPYAHVWFEKVL